MTDEAQLRSLRRSGLMCLAMLFWAPIFGAVYVAMGASSCGLALALAGLGGCGVLLLLRVSHRPRLCGNLVAALVFMVLNVVSTFTGGSAAPAQTWLVAVPVLAVFLCGLRWGLAWMFLVALGVTLLHGLEATGFRCPQQLAPVDLQFMTFYSLVGAVTCLYSLALVYELAERAARRKIDAALRRARSAYAQNAELIRAIPNILIGLDREGVVSQWNQAAADFFGLSADGAIGQSLAALPTGLPWTPHSEPRGIPRGERRTLPPHIACKPPGRGARLLELRIAQLEEQDPQATHVLLVASDLTERQRIEANNLRLLEILETTRDLVATAAPDGEVQYLNRGGRQLLGLSASGGPPPRLADLFPSAVFDRFQREVIPHVQRHGAWSGEVAYRHVEGRSIPAWMSVVAHNPTGRHIEFYSMISRDLSEKRKAERMIRERDEWLRQKQRLESIGSLAGGVAHEFNNLLQIVRGYTLLAVEKLAEEGRQSEDLAQVLKASEQAATLTRQLLNFSRNRPLVSETVRVNDLISDLVQLLNPVIGESIRVHMKLDPRRPEVVGDESQLQQALMNLCVNARDAMGGEGTLKLETSVVEAVEIERVLPDAKFSGPAVRLRVADTGVGIPADVLPRIFDPFFTTKPVGIGTGLGLAMVYGALQQHGGTIQVESRPGSGTEFDLYFPAASPQPTDRASHRSTSSGAGPAEPGTADRPRDQSVPWPPSDRSAVAPFVAVNPAAGDPAVPVPGAASGGRIE